MDSNVDLLQSLAEAVDKAPESAKEYLLGYAEGLIAGRANQDST